MLPLPSIDKLFAFVPSIDVRNSHEMAQRVKDNMGRRPRVALARYNRAPPARRAAMCWDTTPKQRPCPPGTQPVTVCQPDWGAQPQQPYPYQPQQHRGWGGAQKSGGPAHYVQQPGGYGYNWGASAQQGHKAPYPYQTWGGDGYGYQHKGGQQPQTIQYPTPVTVFGKEEAKETSWVEEGKWSRQRWIKGAAPGKSQHSQRQVSVPTRAKKPPTSEGSGEDSDKTYKCTCTKATTEDVEKLLEKLGEKSEVTIQLKPKD